MYYYNLYVKSNGLYVLKRLKNRFAYVSQDWLLIDTFFYDDVTNTFQSYFVGLDFIKLHETSFLKKFIRFVFDL